MTSRRSLSPRPQGPHSISRRSVVAGTALIVGVLTLVAAPGAMAATCSSSYTNFDGAGHYYSTELSNSSNYAGVEGAQSPSTLTLNQAQFVINWLGAAGGSGCTGAAPLTACSIQAGYGRGTVGPVPGTHATSSGTQYYAEEGDVNGYLPRFYSSPSPWFVTNVYYSGVISSDGANGRWDAYVSPSTGGHILLESAYFPISTLAHNSESISASTEVFYGTSGTCAQIATWNRFGTDSAGNISSGTKLQTTYGPLISYQPFSSSSFTTGNDSPYQYASVSGTNAFYSRA